MCASNGAFRHFPSITGKPSSLASRLLLPSFFPHSLPQHTSHGDGGTEVLTRSGARGRNSTSSADEQPHVGNYRLLKTIGKGNFAKVKLARHILTGREVRGRSLGMGRWGFGPAGVLLGISFAKCLCCPSGTPYCV